MSSSLPRPSVVSLFSGAGGMDVGVEQAGFETVFATDLDARCIDTLAATQGARVRAPDGRAYLQQTRLVRADVRELDATVIRPAAAPRSWRPDLLVGGPPCQPFSSAGRQRGIEDPRGTLFVEFVRLAQELRPHFVLFENVRGLLTAKTPDGRVGGVLMLVQSAFEGLGYATRFATLNAADFGVAQRRVRLYMIAALDRPLPEMPDATHSRSSETALLPWTTLGQFLHRYPAPDPRDVVRPSGTRVRALSRLTPGTGLRTEGVVEANRPGGHWGYRQDAFLADLQLPARTIRAASTPDWICPLDGSLRRLTWRECAGLQGFPPGWQFVGTTASRFRQIGNAVQTQMARFIAERVLRSLESGETQPQSVPWPREFSRRIKYTEAEARVNGDTRRGDRLRAS